MGRLEIDIMYCLKTKTLYLGKVSKDHKNYTFDMKIKVCQTSSLADWVFSASSDWQKYLSVL